MEALFGHPSYRHFVLQDVKRLPARFFARILIVMKSQRRLIRRNAGRPFTPANSNLTTSFDQDIDHDRTAHTLRQDLGRPCGQRRAGRHVAPLYRPPSGPRGDQPAGLRGPAAGRPQGARARKDARRRRPQRADQPTASRASRTRKAASRSRRWPRTQPISASNIIRSPTRRQGIVHIIGPEQGFTLPGMTIVCGDSHTSTHGAFGALAHGIGTSEVEHVLATQTLIQRKAKNMLVRVDGKLPRRRRPPRTSSSPSSARSARPAAPAMSSNMPARRSARCRWKAA